MNYIIKADLLTEHEPHLFVGYASDLGLPPQLPKSFTTDRRMGNGQKFYLVAYSGGIARYKQEFGCVVLKIFNS